MRKNKIYMASIWNKAQCGKRCEKHGFDIYTCKISDIIKKNGKERQTLHQNGEKK